MHMLMSGSMPVESVYVVCDRHTGLHSRLGWAQVITRTDGRALGVIAHLYVDPRALEVVSLSLRAKGLGGGAAGNMPLAALCQARPYQGAEESVFAVPSLACADWQKEGGTLPAARLQSQCRAPGRSNWQYDGLKAAC